jgi:hypothetical protein
MQAIKKGVIQQVFIVFLAFFQLIFYGLPACGQKFTVIVFPDTQKEIATKPEMFFSQINWIKQSRDSLSIPIVLHVGDIVDLDVYHQWEIASEGFDILDKAGIPYALAVGNHDNQSRPGKYTQNEVSGNINARLRNTQKFNSYFPVYRFHLQRGQFEPGKSDNAYYTFKAGGLNWLVLSYEFSPRRGVLNWAEKVIDDHPDYNVILLTHYFLRDGGVIGPIEQRTYGDLSPQEVYDLLIKNHKNILMVISGHTGTSASRVDEGEHGNKIYEILQDYQGQDLGGGYLRLLTIDPDAHAITAKMYSPYYNKVKEDASRFSFSHVEFVKSFPQKEYMK